MDLNYLAESFSLLKPELAITVSLLVIVIFDLIFNKQKRILHYLALIGLAVTGYFVIAQFELTEYGFSATGSDLPTGLIAIDPFGTLFKFLIVAASMLIVLFSFSSDEIEKASDRLGEYYTLMFGMILGMFMMLSAADLILIYLSVEILSLSSYVLAGFTKLRDRNSEAALKYLIYGAVSSGLMLFGISIVYGLTGTTDLNTINSALLAHNVNPLTFSLAVVLIFVGMGFKISAAPFHFWTPDVYEGSPITITAFLSVASKAAGFGLLVRFIAITFVSSVDDLGNWKLLGIFDWQSLIIVISILTMTLGNFSALWQDNLKRMLAYSSIAHAGYLLLGLAVLSNQGLLAIGVYFFVYLLMNLGAFYIVMMIANKTGTENINDFDGLGYTAPFYGVALTIFLISLTGLPPTAGFIGKLYLFIALVDAKMIAVAVIALLNSVVSLYYYVRILKHMYLNKPTEETPSIKPLGFNLIVTLIMLIPVLVFGVYFSPLINFIKNSLSIFGL